MKRHSYYAILVISNYHDVVRGNRRGITHVKVSEGATYYTICHIFSSKTVKWGYTFIFLKLNSFELPLKQPALQLISNSHPRQTIIIVLCRHDSILMTEGRAQGETVHLEIPATHKVKEYTYVLLVMSLLNTTKSSINARAFMCWTSKKCWTAVKFMISVLI